MRALLGLVLVACGSKSEPEPAPIALATKADCDRAVAHIQELDRTKSEQPEEIKSSPVMQAIIKESLVRRSKLLLDHCVGDKWPKVETDCMINALDFPTSELCSGHLDGYLSQAQIKKLNADYDAIETFVVETVQQRVTAELDGLKALRDEICACKTSACRKAVDDKLAKRTPDILFKRDSAAIETEIAACRK